MADALKGFDVRKLTFRGDTRDVLVSQTEGRPVIIMHEIFGLSPTVVEFARLVVAEGFKVYAPVMFGQTDPPVKKMAPITCLVGEFKALSVNGPGKWADWIRDLAEQVFKTHGGPPGGRGVGVIGLCLTGNLALSATLSPVVTGPVMSEPSLGLLPSGLHVSKAELANAKRRTQSGELTIRGYRYEKDWICPAAKFARLDKEFGHGFDGTTIPADDKELHSVFTEHLRDENGNFRHGELATLIAYLRKSI